MALVKLVGTLLWVLTIQNVQCANILALFPLPASSHFVMFQHLLEELARRGHNIDVVSQFPSKNPPPRYVDHSLVGTVPILKGNLSIDFVAGKTLPGIVRFMTYDNGVKVCEAVFNSPALKAILRNTPRNHYDLVITEIFGPDCMLGFGYVFQVPTISVISSVNLPWGGDRIGNPDNPSFISAYFSHPHSSQTIWSRLINTGTVVISKALFWWAQMDANPVARQFFGTSLPDLNQLALNTSLILVNSHFSVNQARPMVPNFIEVGGLHIKPLQPLNRHFEEMMRMNPAGVILFTMGSMIRTETFPLDKLQAFCNAFGQLKQTILWRGVREEFPKNLQIPSNIVFEKWLPQTDILCHENTKVFISHGGLMGSQEAIYCGVPRLGVPLFADQESNILQAESMGLAIRIGYDELMETKILHAIHVLLNDPSYRDNCKRVSKLFKDRPLSALDTAVYWVEYVIRHKGATHLRSLGADMHWFQYYLVDVFILTTTIIFLVFYGVFKLNCIVFSGKQNKYKHS